MNILKKKSGDIIKTCDAVKDLIKKYEASNLIPDGVKVVYADDLSFYVKRRLGILTQNATLGLLLVALCLLAFIDWKTTFWTTLGMPVALCVAIIVVNAMGGTLNLISMFGFIIVIGMLVDDAIIVSENIYRHKEMGKPPLQAAVDGTQEVLVPLTGMIATTIVAFAPILLVSGIMGKFLAFIPIVVIITIVASYFECLLILPGHLVHADKSKKIIDGKKEDVDTHNQTWILKIIFFPFWLLNQVRLFFKKIFGVGIHFVNDAIIKRSPVLAKIIDLIRRRAWFGFLQKHYVSVLTCSVETTNYERELSEHW